MPKIKTHRRTAKRFKVTSTGKWVFRHAGKSHLNTKKSERRKRRLRVPGQAAPGNKAHLKRLAPYLG